MTDELLLLIGFAFCLLGAGIAWTFVLVYSRPPFDWHTYEAGRHLMYFTFGMAVVLSWSAATLLAQLVFGRPEWLVVTIAVGRLAIFGWIIWMLYHRLRLLLRSRDAGLANRVEA